MVGGKSLWAAHDNEENLLFRESDFKAPGQSKLLPKLLSLSESGAVALTGHLLLASQGPLDAVPLLADLLAGDLAAPLSREQRDRIHDLVPLSRPVPPPPPVPVPILPPSPGSQRGGTHSPLTPILEALPAEPLEAPVPAIPVPAWERTTALVREAPVAILIPPPEALPMALPTESRAKASLSVDSDRRPSPPSAPRRGGNDPPEWFQQPRLAEDRTVARFWPVAVGVAVAGPLLLLLFGLVVWMVWPSAKPPVPPSRAGARPRLRSAGEVLLRAGHPREVVLVVDRQTTTEALTVSVEGLPEGVDCQPASLLPGTGLAQVRLRLNSRPVAAAFSGQMLVRLLHGDEMLDEQRVPVNLKAFVAPRLIKKSLQSIQLLAGKIELIEVQVDANGNTDPWSLRFAPLPDGVNQRAPRGPVPPGHAAVELAVVDDATPREGFITVVTLLADGIPADSMNVSLSVENGSGKGEVALGLDLPTGIRLQAGGTARVKVDLVRNGYSGPVRLDAEELPKGITAEPVIVPRGNNSAQIELKAGDKATSLLRLQGYRVVARVEDKIVGSQDGTFLFERGSDSTSTPGLKKLQGTWVMVNDKLISRGVKVQIEGDKWSYLPARSGLPRPTASYIISVDETKTPSWIDLKLLKGTRVALRGIFVIEDDLLKIRYTIGTTERPANFTDPSRRSVLMNLKRETP
jgi:uncharacterized protein (TIGR03067 family)